MFKILASCKAAIFEFGAAEVDQQTDFDAGGVKVVDDLRLMFGGDGFDGFQFNDDFLLNEYIRIEVAHALPPEHHLDGRLGEYGQTFLP